MRKISFIAIIFIITFLLSSCSAILGEREIAVADIDIIEQYDTPTINQESDIDSLNEDSSNAIADRDNSSAELTTLFAGTFTVGIDIPPGRYVITSDGSGIVAVFNGGRSVFAEILNPDAIPTNHGVPSATIDVEEGQEIRIEHINNVIFTPATTQISNVLTAGDWVVGLDILPGTYNVSPTYENNSGHFVVFSAQNPNRSVVNEILGGSHGVERIRVNLEVGQRIQMHNISSVTFEQP